MNIPKSIKNPIIIQGFPGVGLVGSIAIEYLIEHLKCEFIAQHYFEDLSATIAIHNGNIIYPVNVYYNKEYNFLLLHAVIANPKLEWKMANIINDLVKQTGAKEVICLEGVATMEPQNTPQVFYYTTNPKKQQVLDKISSRLTEGIVVGVTPALLLKRTCNITAFFADTATGLPDSKAAAKLIEAIDKYLNLKVDPKPLLKQAEKFEQKLKGILEQGAKVQENMKNRQLSYVG